MANTFTSVKPIEVVWLSNFNLDLIADRVQWRRRKKTSHPSSWVTNLALALGRRSDVKLSIVTYSPYVTGTQKVDWNGMSVTVVRAGVPFISRGWPSWLPLNAAFGFPLEVHRLRTAVRALGSFDLVHAHGTEDAYALAGLGLGKPCVVSIQGVVGEYYRYTPNLRFWLVRLQERKVVKKAKFFMCRTSFDMGFVKSLSPDAKIFEIWEAMSSVFFESDWSFVQSPRIAFVGGGERRKGLEYLVEAIMRISSDIPDIEVFVAGQVDKDAQGRLGEVARIRNFRIWFLGRLNPEDISRLHRSCRVFVLPSIIENSPNALAEAMVSGMPVIAFDVGGVSSMIEHEVTGLLVPPGDIQGLATAIRRVLTDDELAARLGAAAAKVARARHHPDDVAERTVQAYRRILQPESPRSI